MKAYYFDTPDEGVDFVFANSKEQAIDLCDYCGVTRAKAFDKYAPGPVTDANRFTEEWPVFCRHCERDVMDEELEGLPMVFGDFVYCSPGCKFDHDAEVHRRRENKAAATGALITKYPFVEVTHAYNCGLGNCNERCWEKNRDNVGVYFKVPGGALTEKTSDGYHFHNSYCHGCGQVWIALGDLEKFRLLKNGARNG